MAVEQLDLTIIYEDAEDGWIVPTIPEVPGVVSQGRTRDEARTNVIDALRLMLSPEPGEDEGREHELLHLTIAAWIPASGKLRERAPHGDENFTRAVAQLPRPLPGQLPFRPPLGRKQGRYSPA